jgi:hypothetical protein
MNAQKEAPSAVDPRGILVGLVGGYLGLVFLACWVDVKIHKRRMRKKREKAMREKEEKER